MTALPPMTDAPGVSVVMPVKDEASTLDAAVRAVLGSGYAGPLEVVLAVGPSADDTASIATRLAADAPVVLVDNPSGLTPQALNAAVGAATHDVIVRMDAHALMPAGYIDLAVDALRETGAANVGGRMVPTATSPFGHAVAVAMSSVWGLGSAGHRQGGVDGPAASVYLGAFRREALDAVGLFDAHFERAQDWELNHRLRAAGFDVWFVSQMAVPYTPRSSWAALRRQFFASGQWRREVCRKYPETRTARYMAAPVTVVATASGLVLGLVGVILGVPALGLLLAVPAVYLAGVVVASATLLSRAGWRSAVRLPVVLATMHIAWGLGFLRGVR